VTAVALSDRIVSAWFWGEDARFAEAIDELERAAVVSIWDGIRHLLACCRGRAASEPVGFEQLNVRVMSFLIAATSSESSHDAASFARQAVAAADAAASRFHQVIARVGLALLSPEKDRIRLLTEASAFAYETASAALIGGSSCRRTPANIHRRAEMSEDEQEEEWRTATILAATLTDAELLDLHRDYGHSADTAVLPTACAKAKLLISLVQLGGLEPPTS